MLLSDQPTVAIQQCSSPVTEGDNVTFYCNATGNPVPNITWTRAHSSAVLSSNNELIVEAVKRNASGSYICHAFNGFGAYNTSCNVDVQCKLMGHQLAYIFYLNFKKRFVESSFIEID